jgi:hypothetical protein
MNAVDTVMDHLQIAITAEREAHAKALLEAEDERVKRNLLLLEALELLEVVKPTIVSGAPWRDFVGRRASLTFKIAEANK